MSITIELDERVIAELREEAAKHGHTAEEWLAIQIRQRRAARNLASLREKLQPLAQAAGWKSDEDVFREVS